MYVYVEESDNVDENKMRNQKKQIQKKREERTSSWANEPTFLYWFSFIHSSITQSVFLILLM